MGSFQHLKELRLSSNRLVALPKEIGRDVDVEGMYGNAGGTTGDGTVVVAGKEGEQKATMQDELTNKMDQALDDLHDKMEEKKAMLKKAATKKAKKLKKQLVR